MLDQRFLIRLLSNLRYAGEDAYVLISLSEAEGRAQIRVKTMDQDSRPISLTMPPRFAKGNKSEAHGLGLVFVRAVAFAYGGRTSVRNLSSPGRAEIIVELPSLGRYPDPHFPRVDAAHELLWRHVDANK